MKRAILAVLLCSLPLLAVDVTGTWTGSTREPDQEIPALYVLKQQGNTITGTIGSDPDDQLQIGIGKIEGDQITLDIPSPTGSYKLSLKVGPDGNTITGELYGERKGQTMKAQVELKRK